MSDFIELVLQILFLPFESKIDDTYNKIEEKPRKDLRILKDPILGDLGYCVFGVLLLSAFSLYRSLVLLKRTPDRRFGLSGCFVMRSLHQAIAVFL